MAATERQVDAMPAQKSINTVPSVATHAPTAKTDATEQPVFVTNVSMECMGATAIAIAQVIATDPLVSET